MSIDSLTSFLKEQQPKIEGTCGVPIINFTKKNFSEHLASLMSHTFIATKDYYEAPSGLYEFKIIEPTTEQVNQLITELDKLYDLPSGSLLLNKLNELLETNGENLVFSFILDEKSSPACKGVSITTCGVNGMVKMNQSRTYIRLPENLPDSIHLQFFSKNQQKIIYVDEPIYIIIAHELIHCIQNLSYKDIHTDILNELRNNFSSIKCLKAENHQLLGWCGNFFGGTDLTTWPDELQAMILGFQIETTHVSESQLLSELLKESKCPHELERYKDDVLIPFGHLQPGSKLKDNDSLNFTTLLSQTQTTLNLFAGILPKEQLEMEKQSGSSSSSCSLL